MNPEVETLLRAARDLVEGSMMRTGLSPADLSYEWSLANQAINFRATTARLIETLEDAEKERESLGRENLGLRSTLEWIEATAPHGDAGETLERMIRVVRRELRKERA